MTPLHMYNPPNQPSDIHRQHFTTKSARKKHRDKIIYDRELVVFEFTRPWLVLKMGCNTRRWLSPVL